MATAAEPDPQDDGNPLEQPVLGRRLRALRQKRGHTLAVVADGTGLSNSFVALVERGGSDISLGRLYRLLRFYDVELDELVPPSRTPDVDHYILRRGEGKLIEIAAKDEGIQDRVLAPDAGRRMTPILSTRERGSRVEDIPAYDGEVFIYIVEGALLLEQADGVVYVLYEGDSCYYAPPGILTATSVGPGTTRVLSVAVHHDDAAEATRRTVESALSASSDGRG
jgi:transcriptional regulator with XRE-family HTH domain